MFSRHSPILVRCTQFIVSLATTALTEWNCLSLSLSLCLCLALILLSKVNVIHSNNTTPQSTNIVCSNNAVALKANTVPLPLYQHPPT